MISIVIATTKTWNIRRARGFQKLQKGTYKVIIISKPEDLTASKLKKISPKIIFFPHWSWIIPEDIWSQFTCVVFHMTDLPFGRGGSPLQNLISRGIYQTKISALKVDGGLDTGPIYIKKHISIKEGTAEEILTTISGIIFEKLIPFILRKQIAPKPQLGTVVSFKRRKALESHMLDATLESTRKVYDFIRMLDGEGYPLAYVNLGNGLKVTFQKAVLKKGVVNGIFTVTKENHV